MEKITSSSDGAKLAATETFFGSGYIYTSTDSGATWSTQSDSSGLRNWFGITSSSDGAKLAAYVTNGLIYTSTDSGATWSTQSDSSGSRNWTAITSSSDGAKLAATVNNGYIYTSTDSGATWSTQSDSSGSRSWRSITSSSDGAKLAAVVANGYIYTSTDSGATWTEQTTAGSRNWNSITSSSDGAKLAATVSGGYVYISDDSGATWTEQTTAGSRSWREVTSSSDGTKLAASVYGGYIYTYVEAPSSGGSGGGRSSHLQSTCTPSDRSVSVGDKVSFDIDIDSSDDYTFKWTRVLEGNDEDETHTFTESGTYYPRAEIKNESGDKVVVNCGTITVSEDDDSSSSSKSSSINKDEDETTSDSPLIALLKVLGIDIPSNIDEILKSLNNTTTPTPTTTNTFTIDLELGDNHSDVKLLQQFLNKHNFTVSPQGPGSLGNETTIFGYATQSALIKFQQANNITPAVGYFGPITRGVVNNL